MLQRITTIAAIATMPMIVSGTALGGDDDVIDKLQKQVDALQSEVAEMKQASGQDWLTEQRAEEITALVQDVLADADTRASLLGSGMTAGWDKKFFLASEDGNFKLNIEGQLQVRYVWNSLDGTPGLNDDGDDVEDSYRYGFQVRRAKLKFSGHVVDPTWQFSLQGAFVVAGNPGTFTSAFGGTADIPFTGDFSLEHAWIKKKFDGGWHLRVGQFKGPFMWEELVSSKRQLAVERSLVNEEFNQDRSQGIEVGWTGDQFRAKFLYSDGFRSRNTLALIDDTEYAFMGRVDWMVVGDNWKQFNDFTSWSDDDRALKLGAAFAIDRGEFGSSANDNLVAPNGEKETVTQFTVDAQYEAGGWNLFAYYVYRDGDELDVTQQGFVVQGGVFIVPDEWEIFARYAWSDFDVSGIEDLSVITFGFNRYFAKHQLKWTTDIGIGLEEVSDEYDSVGNGWRSDVVGEDGQVVIRSQIQLLF